jgi:broad specificity phosphatase PhoE
VEPWNAASPCCARVAFTAFNILFRSSLPSATAGAGAASAAPQASTAHSAIRDLIIPLGKSSLPRGVQGKTGPIRDTVRRMEILLVRHGETEWSRDRKHTGRTDLPLTDTGRREAGKLREAVAGRSFARVLSSPLSRALETCRLAGLGDQAELTGDLCEWDYGEYEGITTAEIRKQRPDWYLWRDGCPDGETAADVGRRVDRVIASVSEVDGDVALFAHGHVLRVLTARWLGLGPEAGALFKLDTGTLSVLGYERETRVITRWNAPVPGSEQTPR